MTIIQMPTVNEAWEEELGDMTPGERFVAEGWRGALEMTALAACELRTVWPEHSSHIPADAHASLVEALHALETAWLRLNGLAGLMVGDDYAEVLREEDPTPSPLPADEPERQDFGEPVDPDDLYDAEATDEERDAFMEAIATAEQTDASTAENVRLIQLATAGKPAAGRAAILYLLGQIYARMGRATPSQPKTPPDAPGKEPAHGS